MIEIIFCLVFVPTVPLITWFVLHDKPPDIDKLDSDTVKKEFLRRYEKGEYKK